MKILVEQMHGLGDTVCAIPMLRVLRAQYPEAYIHVLVKFAGGKDILESAELGLDRIQIWNIYQSLPHTIRTFRELRAEHFDIAVCGANTPVRKARYFMRLIAPERWVGLQARGEYFDSLNDTMHFVEANLCGIADICRLPAEKIYPRLVPNAASVARLRETIGERATAKRIVGLCIGNADYSLKNRLLRTGRVYTRAWGTANMTSLAEMLAREDVLLLLIGGPAECALVPQMGAVADRANVINFVGATNIAESIALVSLCDTVIGVDTGMQHIAAAVGTRTVSIFGPTNPQTHGAYSDTARFVLHRGCPRQFCYGTEHYVGCHDRQCLQNITPSDVLAAFNADE